MSKIDNIKITLETITPEVAARWLDDTEMSGFSQRPLSAAVVNKYAKEMANGTWYDATADVIRVCAYNGHETVVLDGQHRLHAIVKTKKPQKSFVAVNVPPEAFKHIDVGSPRNLSMMMAANGWENPQIMAVAASMLYRFEFFGDPTSTNQTPTPGTVLGWLIDKHPDFHDLAVAHKRALIVAGRRLHLQPADVLFFFYHWKKADPQHAYALLSWLYEPEKHAPPHAVYKHLKASLDRSHQTILDQKAAGLVVRSNSLKRLHMLQLRFSWLIATGVVKHQVTSGAGYSRVLSKWLPAANDTPWILV